MFNRRPALLKDDHGEPLTCANDDYYWSHTYGLWLWHYSPVVTGIASYYMIQDEFIGTGTGCINNEGNPGIYVNVYNYLDWIYEKTGSDLGKFKFLSFLLTLSQAVLMAGLTPTLEECIPFELKEHEFSSCIPLN